MKGFPGSSVVNNSPANAGDTDSIPELRRSPEEGNDNTLQGILGGYSPWGHKKFGHDSATKNKKKNLSENPSIFSKEQQTISNIYVKGKGLKQSKQFFFKEEQSWRTPVT